MVSSAPRFSPLQRTSTICTAGFVLLGLVSIASAQYGSGYYYNPRASTPSSGSALSRSNLQTFYSGGGLLGQNQTSSRGLGGQFAGAGSPSTLGSLSTLSTPRGRRGSSPTSGYFGGSASYGQGSLMGVSSLTGRPYSSGFGNFSDYSRFGGGVYGRSSLARSYSDYIAGNWALGMPPTTNQLSIGSRGGAPPRDIDETLAGAGLWPRTQPATDGDASNHRTVERVSLAVLVSTQLEAKRKERLDKGWVAFQQGDYQRACDEFVLADGYGSISKREQLETHVPLIFARVAVRQFAEAIGALEWVLDQYAKADEKTRRELPPQLLDLLPNLVECYGRRYELDEQLRDLGAYVAMRDSGYRTALATPGGAEDAARLQQLQMQARALQIFVLSAVPDQRPRLLSEVRGFSTAPSPWNQLSNLLDNRGLDLPAAQGTDKPLPGNRPAANFPFNMLEERPLPDDAPRTAPLP